MIAKFPHLLGAVAIGEVVERGAGIRRFTLLPHRVPPSILNDIVATADLSAGTYAQYVAASESDSQADISGLPPEQGVELLLALLSAVQAVDVAGQVKSGERVLVTAGNSATGNMAIQVARALGAKVAGQCQVLHPPRQSALRVKNASSRSMTIYSTRSTNGPKAKEPMCDRSGR